MLEPGERTADGSARIAGERLVHLREVQQWQAGDVLRAGEIDGQLGEARIVAIDEQAAVLRVESLDQAPPPALPCTLVLALPRPKMLKRILVDATSLGIKRICLINSYHVDKSYWSSPQLGADAIGEKCRLGLAQAIDTRLPRVTLHKRFRPFVEDELPAIIGDSRALLAHPAGDTECPRNLTGPATLVVGPEGGFIPFEVDLLRAAGCQAVTLGARILRVDTAVPVLLGRLYG